MEPKDLNTFINNKLNQGNGLRYREEYWNDMNGLLDANMPVAKAEGTASNATTQTTTTGFKLSYLISACAAAVTGIIVCFQLFNAPTSVSTANSSPANSSNTPATAQTITPTPPSVPQQTQTESSDASITAEEKQNPEHPTENNGGSQPPDKTTTLSANAASSDDHNSSKNTLTPATKSETSDIATTITQSTEKPSGGSFIATPSDEQVSTHTTDLIMIEPMSRSTNTNQINTVTENSVLPPHHPKRNRLIQHIDVSPFAGMVFEKGNQTYQSGNTVYTHPSQSHFTYGINVECATKQFSVRTGIGLSSTSLRSTTTSANNIYDVDTSYIIVDPHYGTTPSGKPIALIQQKLDSTYVSTQYTTTEGKTTYQYVTIPLTLQYKLAHKRFTLMLEGGGLHHIMVSQQTESTLQTQSENHVSLPAYSFQLTAGSSIRYAITSHWAVGVQYNYNLNPSSANLHFLNNSHTAVFMLTRSIR